MSRLVEALSNSADGAIVIDEGLCILYCNKAGEAILGFENGEIVGHFCYRLLRGCDESRQLVCSSRCRVAKMILEGTPVPNYDVQITTNYGVKRWMNMSVFAYKMDDLDGKKVVVHLFRDLNQRNVNDKLLTDLAGMLSCIKNVPRKNGNEKKPLLDALTPRQVEVLALLVSGRSTWEIAKALSISTNTVRNHIQNILQKFQVHSRLEAVTLALKNDLL